MDTPFKVLSLEDSDLDFEIISEQLIKAGYNLNIARAENEQEFTDLISRNCYDIILADYNLPQFDAFEALKICQDCCPDVPFICVSGSIGEMKAIELMKKGAVDYVIKDRIERLPFAVKRALEDTKEKIARRQMEESLRLSEEKYRTIFENVQDVFYQTDLNGIIRELSPSIKHFSDFDREELMGKPVVNVYHNPDDRIKLLQILTEKGEVRDYEIKLKTKNGEIKYASTNARLIYNSQGIPDHIDGALRDITARKHAEEMLKQSEARMRDILFSSMDWVWEVDEQGRYTYSSQRDIDLFDVAPDEIIGKTPFDFMSPDEADKMLTLFTEIAANKQPIKDLENWNIGKDGRKICLLTNGVPILDKDGQLLGYRGVDKNITEKKRAEQELINAKEKAEESDRLKTAFLSNMSHEIRTPLNSIIGFSDLLLDPFFGPDKQREFVKTIRKSGNNLIAIIDDIMDIAKIETGQINVEKNNFSVTQFLMNIGFEQSHLIKKRGLEIQVNTPDRDVILNADEGRIKQILSNLINNAIKFSDGGTIEIGCNLAQRNVQFYVKDSGIGIPKEFHEKIFDRFRQIEPSHTRKYGGMGLGLSISKQLAELMDGEIIVESEPGKGSTFILSLPG